MSKLVLHTFGGSVWGAVAELAVAELEYPDDAVEIKIVNLINGENFRPAFIRLNPNATLPTLETGSTVITNSTDVTSYLIQHAPVRVNSSNSALTKLLHEDKYDPNFSLLSARNEEELSAKRSDIPGIYLSNRQAALKNYYSMADAAPHKAFYDDKLTSNGALLSIYEGRVSKEIQLDFFEKSQAHFDSVSNAIHEIIPKYLPSKGFLGADRPGEDDFHLAAWLARIAATIGAKQGEDGLQAFELAFGRPVPEKVASYWNAWMQRASWKRVYAAGLH